MTWNPPPTPLLDRVVKVLFRRLKQVSDDPRKLPVVDQTVLAVYGAQGVIDNGGVRFFFESDWPGRPPYAFFVDAYRRIGARAATKGLERAVARLPGKRPHLAILQRNRFMDALKEEDAFFDDKICGDVTVWAKLEEYVRENANALWRRPTTPDAATTPRRTRSTGRTAARRTRGPRRRPKPR